MTRSMFLVLTFLFSASCFALVSTTVKVPSWPSEKQLLSAKVVIDEAVAARRSNDLITLKEKLEMVSRLTTQQLKPLKFKAAFYVDNKKAFTSSLEQNLETKIWDRKLTYTGESDEALALLRTCLDSFFWRWDEEWVENPRLAGDNIVIDYVDGPNEQRSTLTITRR